MTLSDISARDEREFWEYVKTHTADDPHKLILSDSGKNVGFSVEMAAVQIECRRRTRRKLAMYLEEERFLFPSLLAAEQATHQCVSSYHALLAGTGHKMLDMTAGLGIDAFRAAVAGNEVTAVEIDAERAAALRHNRSVLGLDNMKIVEGDSLAYLTTGAGANRHYDIIFVDPARRDALKNRTFLFKDCLPDIVTNYDLIAKHAHKVMVKVSPVIDIAQSIRELQGISEFHIVCVNGECKEVLIVIEADKMSRDPIIDPIIKVADLKDLTDGRVEHITRWECKFSELSNEAPIAEPEDFLAGNYLYDPNAGLHKINSAKVLTGSYADLRRAAANTDLYVSLQLYEDFPGRIFKIDGELDKAAQKALKGEQREVATRNYPLGAEDLRKKLKLKPGGNGRYIWGLRAGRKAQPLLIEAARLILNNPD